MEDRLLLFNTLSGRKEPFAPLRPPEVKVFVCGPTVQSQMHLGHAKTYLFYDSLVRYLRHLGYRPFCLMNITDIDETITKAARKMGEDPLEFSARMTRSFLADFKRLKITSIDRIEPASRHVGNMIRQVSSLMKDGFAYQADGWVYFDTTRFPRWGRLSHQSKQDLALRPLELSRKKRNLNDFALWRPENLVPGRWRSPWGFGSPGWHIQDTAITIPILGPKYDVHGGAYELVYPHHEAEIAQGESLTGEKPLVRYWVHTSLVNMEGQKMSKSLGNVVTVQDGLKHFTADELRFYFLSMHYREDGDLSGLAASRQRLKRLRRAAGRLAGTEGDEVQLSGFERALNDDFDSPRALTWAERTLTRAGKEGRRAKARAMAQSAVEAMGILGVELLADS